ncbi:MAG: ribonuclease HI family protein [Candidatus Geothermincolia bacterium]
MTSENADAGRPAGRAAGDWLRVCTDGAARGNPGPAGAGAQALDPSGEVVVEISEFLGHATNNVAEYYALIMILEASRHLGYSRLKVFTDSQLMANQITGGYRVKNHGLKPLAARVKALLDEYREVEVQYIPRAKNTACDALANKAVDEGLQGLKEPLLTTEDERLF